MAPTAVRLISAPPPAVYTSDRNRPIPAVPSYRVGSSAPWCSMSCPNGPGTTCPPIQLQRPSCQIASSARRRPRPAPMSNSSRAAGACCKLIDLQLVPVDRPGVEIRRVGVDAPLLEGGADDLDALVHALSTALVGADQPLRELVAARLAEAQPAARVLGKPHSGGEAPREGRNGM